MSKQIAIIGGGPAGLMAADVLSSQYQVHLFEMGKTIGRKFLVAGKGGFNLTNHLSGAALQAKYHPIGFLNTALSELDAPDLRNWLSALGIPTYVGSSGRIFPQRGIKPAEVLKAIRLRLEKRGVQFHFHHQFVGFDQEFRPFIQNAKETFVPQTAYYLLALGGASWAKTGSDGQWRTHFEQIGVPTHDFAPSNCGVNINWPAHIKTHHLGKPLKNIQLFCGEQHQKGEALISEYGLEGNAIYPIIPAIRDALAKGAPVSIHLDLKPNNDLPSLLQKVAKQTANSKTYAKALNLNGQEMALLKAFCSKADFQEPSRFVHLVKKLPLPVLSLRPLDEAISTIGGIPCSELNTDFSLKKHPHLYCIGEMVDWDTPTGGFLLQGCMAMGYSAGKAILAKQPLPPN
ncbi:MAG: TIGR03862 family flavoprotein [Bacteroidota bacterium]